MKKYFILALTVLLASQPAFAVLSASQIWKLNNRMGKVASEVQLGSILSGLEISTVGALTSAHLFVGNGAGAATDVAVSGDLTLANTGAFTVAANAITSAKILDGQIVNADLSNSAAVAFSKLAALSDGHILVGSGANVATSVAVSGDVTLANTGAFTIGSGKVTSANILNGEIVNADLSASAAIAHSKLAAMTSGYVLIGSAGTVPTAVALAGDVTVVAAGTTTIGANKVLTGMIKDGEIVAADLTAGLQPSHVIKFAGSTASEVDADASVVKSITGLAATDFVTCSIRAAATAAVVVRRCVPTADTLTVTLSENGGAGTVIDYIAVRAVP